MGTHGHFTVNGQRVDIPSYLVKAGDVIEVKESSRLLRQVQAPDGEDAPTVSGAQVAGGDKNALMGTVVQMPARGGHRSARRGAPDRRAVLQVTLLVPRLLVSCIGLRALCPQPRKGG